MAFRQKFKRAPIAAAILSGLAAHASAQVAEGAAQLPTVTVTAPSPTSTAGITGFGDTPLSKSPLQATVVTLDSLIDSGGTGLSALTRFDASVSDAYNSEGYWTNFTVRGFALDNQFNYRRDGLPINAETSLGLENKSRVEVLKGTSGIQAGTSAPGGLVNLVVKRPDGNRRTIDIGWREDGNYGAAVDLSQRFGAQDAFGLRLNVAAQRLDPQTYDDKGDRHLIALAGDWRVSDRTLLEAEIEVSHQSQPSVPGFSLLGGALPDARSVDPRINLNNQPWSQPVVLDGTTGSLRWQQTLSTDWKFVAHGAVQRLRSDDRLAYSFGCSAEDNFSSYCSDGSFDYYDFHSDGERRDTDALDLHFEGKLATGPVTHQITAGALASHYRSRLHPRVDDGVVVGTGTVDGKTIVPTLPADLGLVPNTDLTQRSTEIYARDQLQLTSKLALWAGLRHTKLHRESIGTDGSESTSYDQSFTTPWLALSYALTGDLLAYASWGEGVESEVAPNRSQFANAGQALPALKSRQYEVGLKRQGDTLDWSLDWFEIHRPQFDDIGPDCGNGDALSCTHQVDGSVHNRGIEASAKWSPITRITLNGSAMWLDAKRRDSADPALDGKRPTNVAERSIKLNGRYDFAAIAGLSLDAGMVYEGPRTVLPDNSISIPGWTRFDLAARWQQRAGKATLTWLVGVDNVADRRAWKESPYQYDHAYLFPLAPRTWRLGLQAEI